MTLRPAPARVMVLLLAGTTLPSLAGCASLGGRLAKEAARGDHAGLARDVATAEAKGDLSRADAVEVARAVAERAITTAKPEDLLATIRDVRACAVDLEAVLSARAKTMDRAGAEATMVLLEAGAYASGNARDHLHDANDAWRAVAARALTRGGDCAARADALVDPDPRVRRASLRARMTTSAGEGACGDGDAGAREVTTLLEAARLDPDVTLRNDAVRALAHGTSKDDAPRVVHALRDLEASADAPLRDDLARAYASPHLFAAGGREALQILLARQGDAGGVEASAAILAQREPDPALTRSAIASLVHALKNGSRRDRLHALVVAPLSLASASSSSSSSRPSSPEWLAALRDASHGDDADVVLAALTVLANVAAERAAAVQSLERLAGQPDAPRRASEAKLALALAGDVRVQAWVERDLTSPSEPIRMSALRALASLGKPQRAAPLLADEDASVRLHAACTILVSARLSR